MPACVRSSSPHTVGSSLLQSFPDSEGGDNPRFPLNQLQNVGYLATSKILKSPKIAAIGLFGDGKCETQSWMDAFTHSVFMSLHFCQLLFKLLPMFCSFSI